MGKLELGFVARRLAQINKSPKKQEELLPAPPILLGTKIELVKEYQDVPFIPNGHNTEIIRLNPRDYEAMEKVLEAIDAARMEQKSPILWKALLDAGHKVEKANMHPERKAQIDSMVTENIWSGEYATLLRANEPEVGIQENLNQLTAGNIQSLQAPGEITRFDYDADRERFLQNQNREVTKEAGSKARYYRVIVKEGFELPGISIINLLEEADKAA